MGLQAKCVSASQAALQLLFKRFQKLKGYESVRSPKASRIFDSHLPDENMFATYPSFLVLTDFHPGKDTKHLNRFLFIFRSLAGVNHSWSNRLGDRGS